MTIYSLYVKTHKKTGLKYFGYTKQDPLIYPGSGTDWKIHLKKYGYQVHTEVLLQTMDKIEIVRWGIFYSTKWNIVGAQDDFGNKIWANKIPESGSGAGRKAGTVMRTESKNLIRAKAMGRKQSEEHIEKRISKIRGRPSWNKGISYLPEERKKFGRSGEENPMFGKPVPKKVCPHCNKEVDIRNHARSHGDKCKFK